MDMSLPLCPPGELLPLVALTSIITPFPLSQGINGKGLKICLGKQPLR